MRRRTVRRRAMRASLLLSNVAILAVIIFFVLQNHTSGMVQTPVNTASSAATANPLDQVSSADIAQTVAQLTALPETVAVTNQAESQAADLAIASTDNDVVITKPQVVATALKSKADIQDYITQAGDTLASLATKFGVTSNSIAWSNNISTAGAIAAGTKLVIPPVNGIVYTVKAGDTPASLASAYGSNADQITAYNDAELNGLQPGEQIIIPNGTQPAPAIAGAAYAAAANSTTFPWGGNTPVYGSNGYDFGYCTWYVATQISVPGNWGNADAWAHYAAMSGWNVSLTPTVGAIAQTSAGYEGHVAVVEAVSADGTMIEYRDMNNYGDGGGWDKVGQAWAPASLFEHYITH